MNFVLFHINTHVLTGYLIPMSTLLEDPFPSALPQLCGHMPRIIENVQQVGFVIAVEGECVMRIRIIFSLSVMQFQTFLELSYNL